MLTALILSQLIDYKCDMLQNDPKSPTQIEQFETISTSEQASQIKMYTTDGAIEFKDVERSTDRMNDENLLSFVSENFSILMDLNENPIKGSINPFIVKGKTYGPFYFACVAKK